MVEKELLEILVCPDDLTPVRLAGILRACDLGDLDQFLVLAEEMEERDMHYSSQLGTR